MAPCPAALHVPCAFSTCSRIAHHWNTHGMTFTVAIVSHTAALTLRWSRGRRHIWRAHHAVDIVGSSSESAERLALQMRHRLWRKVNTMNDTAEF
jgi:hypothetical protein